VSTLLQRRQGTRVRAQIPLRLTSIDPEVRFSENCHTVLVNPRGCGVRFGRALKPGLRVRVEGLPGGGSVIARVACNLPPSPGSKFWMVGIGVDSPSNLWCLAPTPEDWGNYSSPTARFAPLTAYSPASYSPSEA
jgi:hypothetical protein